MAKDDWELWIDDTNTASPEEIKRLESAIPPEQLREFEAKIKAIAERAFDEVTLPKEEQ